MEAERASSRGWRCGGEVERGEWGGYAWLRHDRGKRRRPREWPLAQLGRGCGLGRLAECVPSL